MPIVAFSSLLRKNQKSSNKMLMLPPVGIEPRALRFQVQHAPSWATEAIACKAKTLSSLYSHALLILTESSKSKNEVVHEQKFKDLPSSKCPVRVAGACWTWNLRARALFPLGVTFYHWIFFYFHKVKTKMPQLPFAYSL